MAVDYTSAAGLARRATTLAVALMTLASGVYFGIKSGGNNNDYVIQGKTQDGRITASLTGSGNLTLSGSLAVKGSLTVGGATISSYKAGQGLTLNASNAFSTNSTLTGATVKAYTLLSGATLNVGGGQTLLKIYSNTAVLDFGNLAAIGCENLTMAVNGAALGDVVELGVPNASTVANGQFSAWVDSANSITIKFCTVISGDPASGTFRAAVFKF